MILLGMSAWAYGAMAQRENPPVPVEAVTGNRGVALQMIVNKKLRSVPSLGVFSVTNFVSEWESKRISDLMTQTSLTWQVVKGLDLMGGVHVTPFTGTRPSAGLMYTFANRKWLAVANQRFDLMKNGAVEMLLLAEFKPAIGRHLDLYTRAQALYAFNTEDAAHERSYAFLRAGITWKDVTIGAAANLDYYGPQKVFRGNYGGFLIVQLF